MSAIYSKIYFMRADRLISIILLLQKRKKINAEKLAEELGVSVRTIYRDIVILSANGFPVYSEHGPGGGVCIVEDYRGGVKTLTADEVDALQMMQIPDPLISLETGKTMQRALLKMFAALPESREHSPNIYIDWNWWGYSKNETSGKLEKIYNAVCNQNTIHVSFPLWNRMDFEQDIDPYGVVAKAGGWYLVYSNAGRVRMRRISDFISITPTSLTFKKPVDFNLESTWKSLCLHEELSYFIYPVNIRYSQSIFPLLREPSWGVPFQMSEAEIETELSGWKMGTLIYENLIAARTHLLGFGNAVEVLSPDPLRISMLDFAEQIQKTYQRQM